ncbi:MAG: hypothetical protein JWO08_608 [Verrucomicrobiaceae bacterium]|nr:hypothetical protein [Verrucomicrobiaceae bacterium]
MISIATGTNILRPGPRTWLAGCPWVSPNAWSAESSTPQAPTRESFTAKGAFWRAAKSRDLGNVQTVWSFTSHIQLASFQASAAFVAGLTEAGTWQGVLEWWVPQADSQETYAVYRAAECAVQCTLLEVVGVGVTVAYRATFGVLTFCGSETVYLDVLGDGLGNVRGDYLSSGWLQYHHVIGPRAYDGVLETGSPPSGGDDDDPGGDDGPGGGGGPSGDPPPGDILGTGFGDELGTGIDSDVLGTGI